MFEVVVTLYLASKVLVFALPQTYYDMNNACPAAAAYAVRHVKKNIKASAECHKRVDRPA